MIDTLTQKFILWSHRIQFILMALLFCVTPFLMSSQTTEIFEFNKMIFIYFVTITTCCVWLLTVSLRGVNVRSVPWYAWLFIPFVLTLIISTWLSIDVHTSIFGYYGRWNGGLFSIIAYIFLSLVFYQSIHRIYVLKILKWSAITSFFVIVWGLLAKIGTDPSCIIFTGKWTNACWTDQFRPSERMFSTIGQPNWLGTYLAISFFVACSVFVSTIKLKKISQLFASKNLLYTCLVSLYLILNILGILFTKSRSSLGAVIFGLIIWGCFALRGFKKALLLYIALLVITAAGVVYFRSSLSSISPLYEAPGLNQHISSSLDIRKVVWIGAWKLAREYPYFGTGPETFGYSYFFTRPTEHNLTSEWDFLYNKAHNEYLNYAATTGFIGLSAYLLLIIGVLAYAAVKLRVSEQAVVYNPTFYLTLAFVMILVTDFFGFSTSISHLYFFLIPVWIAIIDHSETEQEVQINHVQHKAIHLNSAILIAYCVLWFMGIRYLSAYYKADILYSRAKIYASSSDYVDAMNSLSDALKLRYEHVYEDKLSQVLSYIAFEVSLKKNSDPHPIIKLSEGAHTKALRASPQNILYWKSQARNQFLYYQATHEFQYLIDASESMVSAVRLAPTDAQTRYSLAIIYQTMEKESVAVADKTLYHCRFIDTLKETIQLKPNYIEGQNLLKAG